MRGVPHPGIGGFAARMRGVLFWAAVTLGVLAVHMAAQTPPVAAQACAGEPQMRAAALATEDLGPSEDYIRCFPGSEQILFMTTRRDRLEMESAFRRAQTEDTPELWRIIIEEYPSSQYVPQAIESMRRLEFTEYGTSTFEGVASERGLLPGRNACRSACSHRQECRGFSYNAGTQYCTLWSAIDSYKPDPDHDSGSRRPVAAAPAAPPPPPPAQFTSYPGMTLSGQALTSGNAPDMEVCQASCAGNPNCQAFTYRQHTRFCALWRSVANARPDAGAQSGLKGQALLLPPAETRTNPAPSGPARFSREQGIDFDGGDITPNPVRNISLDRCERNCGAHPGCKAYTYNVSRQACFLKHSIPRRISRSDAISGTRR